MSSFENSEQRTANSEQRTANSERHPERSRGTKGNMVKSESMQSSVIWYRVPWGKSDSLRVFAGILLTVGVRASPIVFASSFVALERPTAILVVLGLLVGGVIIAGVMTVINLTAERSMTPLAIGIDDGHIHLDRSLWTYGVDVESIPVSTLRSEDRKGT
ncbi:MAG: hypothetical protein IPG73_13415 [Ignavibacteria bacterium]|nr:hypothetical protein [Ignavibacteria bacterium]